jgi:hypothetical protein
LVNTALNV